MFAYLKNYVIYFFNSPWASVAVWFILLSTLLSFPHCNGPVTASGTGETFPKLADECEILAKFAFNVSEFKQQGVPEEDMNTAFEEFWPKYKEEDSPQTGKAEYLMIINQVYKIPMSVPSDVIGTNFYKRCIGHSDVAYLR